MASKKDKDKKWGLNWGAADFDNAFSERVDENVRENMRNGVDVEEETPAGAGVMRPEPEKSPLQKWDEQPDWGQAAVRDIQQRAQQVEPAARREAQENASRPIWERGGVAFSPETSHVEQGDAIQQRVEQPQAVESRRPQTDEATNKLTDGIVRSATKQLDDYIDQTVMRNESMSEPEKIIAARNGETDLYLTKANAYERMTPDNVKRYLEDILSEPMTLGAIYDDALAHGMKADEYVDKVLLPNIEQKVAAEMVARHTPKSTLAYLASSTLHQSLLGRVMLNLSNMPKDVRALKQEGLAQYDEGLSRQMEEGNLSEAVAAGAEKLGAMALPFVADAGPFRLLGAVSNVAGLGRLARVSALSGNGLLSTAARMGLHEGGTFGLYEGTSGLLNDIAQDEVSVWQAAKNFGMNYASGALTGFALGSVKTGLAKRHECAAMLNKGHFGKPQEALRAGEKFAATTAVFAVSDVMKRWATDPNFDINDVDWGDVLANSALTTMMIELAAAPDKIRAARAQKEALGNVHFTEADKMAFRNAGIPVVRDGDARKWLFQNAELYTDLDPKQQLWYRRAMGIIENKALSVEQKNTLLKAAGLNPNVPVMETTKLGDVQPYIVLDSKGNPVTQYRVDEFDGNGTFQKRTIFATEQEAQQYREEMGETVTQNWRKFCQQQSETVKLAKATPMAFAEMFRRGVYPEQMTGILAKDEKNLTGDERKVREEFLDVRQTFMDLTETPYEDALYDIAEKHGVPVEAVRGAVESDSRTKLGDQVMSDFMQLLEQYTKPGMLDNQKDENATRELISDGELEQLRSEGRKLYVSGDAKAMHEQVLRFRAAKARHEGSKADEHLFEYYLRQKAIYDAMLETHNGNHSEAYGAAEKFAKSELMADADGNVRVVRMGDKAFVVLNADMDSMIVVPVETAQDGTIDFASADRSRARTMMRRDAGEFEMHNVDEVMRSMYPNVTAERDAIFGDTKPEVGQVVETVADEQGNVVRETVVGTDGNGTWMIQSEDGAQRAVTEEELTQLLREQEQRVDDERYFKEEVEAIKAKDIERREAEAEEGRFNKGGKSGKKVPVVDVEDVPVPRDQEGNADLNGMAEAGTSVANAIDALSEAFDGDLGRAQRVVAAKIKSLTKQSKEVAESAGEESGDLNVMAASARERNARRAKIAREQDYWLSLLSEMTGRRKEVLAGDIDNPDNYRQPKEIAREQIEKLAGKLGVKVVFTDNMYDTMMADESITSKPKDPLEASSYNGYRRKDGTIVINTNSEHALVWTMGHETGHQVEEAAPQQYEVLKAAILDTLDPLFVAQKMESLRGEEVYKNSTDSELLSEIANDGLGRIFTDERAFGELMKRLGVEEAKTLADKIKSWVGQTAVMKTLKQTWDSLTKKAQEANPLLMDGERGERLLSLAENAYKKAMESGRVDKQGNPIDENGKLFLENVKSLDEISDDDFIAPKRNIVLPQIPQKVTEALGINGKPVVIKKNIFERNLQNHPDVTAEDGREILHDALYDTNLYGQNQKVSRPYNWVVINTKKGDRNRLVLLEINENKDNVEIVHWHFIDDRGLQKIRRQAAREGGQLLILPSEFSKEVGALSDLTRGLSSESKGKDIFVNDQENGVDFSKESEKEHENARLEEQYRETERLTAVKKDYEKGLQAGRELNWRSLGRGGINEISVYGLEWGLNNRILGHRPNSIISEGADGGRIKVNMSPQNLVDTRDHIDALERLQSEYVTIRKSPVVTDGARRVIDSNIYAIDYAKRYYELALQGDKTILKMEAPQFSKEDAEPKEIERHPIFLSNAEVAVRNIKQDKATAEQWLAMAEKMGGIKAGEDKWMGLSDWLRSKKGEKLTKDEVLKYIMDNSIQVEDVHYQEASRNDVTLLPKMREYAEEYRRRVEEEGDPDAAYEQMVSEYGEDFRQAFYNVEGELYPTENSDGTISDAARHYLDVDNNPINSTRLEYTTEGLENKREIALVVPTIEPYNQGDAVHFGDAGDGRAVAWVRFGDVNKIDESKIKEAAERARDDYRKYLNSLIEKYGADYKSKKTESEKHELWRLFEARTKANGAVINGEGEVKSRILVLDEIQSKRHQDGRENGYQDPALVSAVSRMNELERKMYSEEGISNEEYTELQGLHARGVGRASWGMRSKVPDAPFDKNWHELAMKRMLRFAAENGYDKLAWTTGAQQAERYDIGAVIDQVERTQMFGDTGETRYDLQPKDNSGGISLFVKDGMVTRSSMDEFEGKPLEQVVGKELAAKMLKMKDYSILNIADMSVGGEGMKGFYDEILPRFMNKYGKKWGVKVYDIELPNVEEAGRHMWAVDITPEMKESVMQGQVMFSKEDEKTLMGVHNISEEKLKKAIKLGGLANPSLAVIDTRNGAHTHFGAISLIPKSDLIDSRKGRNAGTYAGDAWTPTYPTVEKRMSDKGYDKFYQELDAATDNRDLYSKLSMEWDSYLEGRGEERLAYWFLKERGVKPEDVMYESALSSKQMKRFADVTDNGKKSFRELSDAGRRAIIDLLAESQGTTGEELLDKYKNVVRKTNENLLAKEPAASLRRMRMEQQNGEIDEFGIIVSTVNDFMYGVQRDIDRKGKINVDTTLRKAFEKVQADGLMSEFSKWLEQKEKRYGVKEVIFDGFTNDGRRKYVPNTLRNASRLMNKQGKENAYGQTGFGATRAMMLKKMRTLEEIRGQKDKIVPDDERLNEALKEASDEMFEVVNALSNMQKISDNPFSNVDYANARLQEALQERDAIDYLNREYGYDIERDGEFAKSLTQMVEHMESLPVKYFETKFERPVMLDEFAIAVVPEKTDASVVEALENAGLEVRTYDGTDEGRSAVTLEAVRDRGDIRFSKEDFSINSKKTSEDDWQIGEKFVSLHSERDREAVREQRNSMSPTAQWREGVGDVMIHSILPIVRKKYADLHEKAKAGDVEAAFRLVKAVVKEDRIRALAEQHPNAKVAFVHAEEATGTNRIPEAYANELADYGFGHTDIVQTNKPQHTGSDRIGRMIRRARFDGDVEAGTEYILVDDHVTMGGTLRDLKDYIESKGGKVVAVTTLTASAGGSKLQPTAEQIEQLKQKGITNEQLKELGIADDIAGLTKGEARELLVLADARADRRPASGRPGDLGEARRSSGGREKSSGQGVDYSKETPAPKEGEDWKDYAGRVSRWMNQKQRGATDSQIDDLESIRTAIAETDTNPSEAEKKSGNYKMGHAHLDGYQITIENPAGSVRRGTDPDGKAWETEMHYTYGYIRGTRGKDGDHIDIFLSENPTQGNVYVVDQVDPKTGKFDEHKVMYGFQSEAEAREAYLSNYEEGWKGLGDITGVSKEEFRKWVDSSKRKTKPFKEYANIETIKEAPVADKAPEPKEGESSLEYSQRVMAWERTQSEAQELSDGEVKFSKRTKDEPKKKGIGYKVFYLKDGKLYPPMVANPGGEDTPMGVWLDADAAPVVAETKSGRKKVRAGGKGTQGGSGQLAYRPGWHLGEIPYASQFNRENAETGEKELFPARFVWAEVEYANDKDYQKEAESYGMTENGKFRHSYAGLPRVPEDGAYKYRTNPDPNTDPWIITGAMRVNRLLTPSEVDEMVTAAGREPQKREQGAVTDAEIEALNGGVRFSKNTKRNSAQLDLFGNPQLDLFRDRQKDKTVMERIRELADGDLLQEIGSDEMRDWDFYQEEYDRRHNNEYGEEIDSYTDMLIQGKTSLNDAYQMYADVEKRWRSGGYATEERTALRAQMDALTDYIDRLEFAEGDEVQGLEGYTRQEVLDAVRGDVEEMLEDSGVDIEIKGMALNGSRLRGDARKDSDLDVVLEYDGDVSEDALFNILNDNPIEIEGIKVDINPITKGKSGTLEQYMARSRQYDEEVGVRFSKEAKRNSAQMDLFEDWKPELFRDGKKRKDGKERLSSVSDERLLLAMRHNEADEWSPWQAEYDRRHESEYEDAVKSYTGMLEHEGVNIADAYQMYANAKDRYSVGGFATDERTALRAQMDALADYIGPETTFGNDYAGERELKKSVIAYVDRLLNYNDIGATIEGVEFIGGRTRRNGNRDESEDLDVIVEYSGDVSEEQMRKVLNDGGWEIGDILDETQIEALRKNFLSGEDISFEIDIKPTRVEESGTLRDYRERVRQYESDAAVRFSKDSDIKKGKSELWKQTWDEVKDNAHYRDMMLDLEPHTIEEVAAGILRGGGLLWGDVKDSEGKVLVKGVRSFMGYKEGERKKFFGLFTSEENGGRGFERVGEEVETECQRLGIPYDENDPMAGVNALQSVLSECGGKGQLNDYIQYRRVLEVSSQIKADEDAEQEALDEEYYDRYGMDKSTYDQIFEEVSGEKERRKSKETIDLLQRKVEQQNEKMERMWTELKAERTNKEGKAVIERLIQQNKAAREENAALRAELNEKRDDGKKLDNTRIAMERRENIRKQLIDYIREQVASEWMPYTTKQELNKLLSAVQNATTQEGLEKAMLEVRNVSTAGMVRAQQQRLDRMLALKVQGVNGKNMSIAKTVDDRTRVILQGVNQRVMDNKMTGLLERMDDLRRNRMKVNAELRRLRRDGDPDGRIPKLEEDLREMESHMTATEQEMEDIRQAKPGTRESDINEELKALEEKMDRAARKEAVWTTEDTDLMTQLKLMQALIEPREFEVQEANIRRQISEKIDLQKATTQERNATADDAKRHELTGKIRQIRSEIEMLKEQRNQAQMARSEALSRVIELFDGVIKGGRESLQAKTEREAQRRIMLIREAVHSVWGKDPNETTRKGQKDIADATKESAVKRLFSAPMSSFDYMTQKVATDGVGKDSWLYRYFMEGKDGVMEAYNTYLIGMREQKDALNAKVEELFGTKNSKILRTDAWVKQAAEADKMEDHSGVTMVDAYGNRLEMPMSKGQATYIWARWQMADGKVKLQNQGFDDTSIAEIEKFVGPKYIELAKWLSSDFLAGSRAKYNERYREMYNTSMARIENYVPMGIFKGAVRQQSDLSEDAAQRKSLETRAGSLINRKFNVLPVDITQSIFDAISAHVEQMENWYAYARVRRDLDAILSNTYFRNQLNANHAGDFERFYEAAAVATKSYIPGDAKYGDETMSILNKGLIAGNIAFRLNTALKQLLSAPAYLGYSQNPVFLGILAKNCATGMLGENWKWCYDHIPSFRERVNVGDLGDNRLSENTATAIGQWLQKYASIGMIPNRIVDGVTVSIGAKAIHDYALRKYLKLAAVGNPTLEERAQRIQEAHRMAKMEADIFYNQTQQSSHPAFLSPMQLSRSLMDRALTVYQNANLGYTRAMMNAARDLISAADYQRTVNGLARRYESFGLSTEGAMKLARQDAWKKYPNLLTRLGLFGWGLKCAWNWGSNGLLGFLQNDDDEKRKDGETQEQYEKRMALRKSNDFISYLLTPVQGTPGGNMLFTAKDYVLGEEGKKFDYNPVLFVDELNKMLEDASKDVQDGGVVNTMLAAHILMHISKFGGIDPQTLGNIYLGVEGLVKDGYPYNDKLIDIMYILNTPRRGRTAAARTTFQAQAYGSEIIDKARELFGLYRPNATEEEFQKVVGYADGFMTHDGWLAKYMPGVKDAEGERYVKEHKTLSDEYQRMQNGPAPEKEESAAVRGRKAYRTYVRYEDIAGDADVEHWHQRALDTKKKIGESSKEIRELGLSSSLTKQLIDVEKMDHEYELNIADFYADYNKKRGALIEKLTGDKDSDKDVLTDIRRLREDFLSTVKDKDKLADKVWDIKNE